MDTTTHRILRAAMAVVFLYAPIAAYIDPPTWLGYLPGFVYQLPVEPTVLLHAFGVVEIILALWFIIGRALLIPSVFAALMLIGIVVTNWTQLDVLFRDVALALVAAALAVDSWRKLHKNPPVKGEVPHGRVENDV